MLQVLRVHIGDFVEINLSDSDVEHYAVMEVTELFEDSQVYLVVDAHPTY